MESAVVNSNKGGSKKGRKSYSHWETARLDCAMATPCSAAFWHHSTAFCSSFSGGIWHTLCNENNGGDKKLHISTIPRNN